ncbi:MAG: glycosyltransferase [Planctomycetota bacterium]|nr:MAG: glycosyltransferase [Planctomycetota bacterium]
MSLRVCVAHIHPPGAWSETFVRAHVEELPCEVVELVGGELPSRYADGRPLVRPPHGVRARARAALRARLLGENEAERVRRALSETLRRERVDVALAEYGPVGVELLAPCRAAGVPLVVCFRGYDASNREVLARVGPRYPDLFRAAAAVVTTSEDLARRLRERGAPGHKLHVIPSGTDLVRFRPGDPAAAPPRFLFVGRLVEKKGPFFLLEAFRRAYAERADLRLEVVGDGPLAVGCRQLVRAWGLAAAVEFAGPLPHAEVARRMASARAYVQHSVTASSGDVEGTPNAVVEASAAGLPVVSTRHGGIPEAVRAGETGLLVDEGDVAGTAAALLRLAEDPDFARRLGAAGREHVERHYDREISLRRLEVLLRAAASQPR